MCAINGFNFSDPALIARMNRVTRHRGPDATGVFEGSGMTLGHHRLSIIDLSERAAQPMRDESGRFVIVFNGEIYNFKELRAELQNEFRFRSESDTEVILNLYKKYGRECVKKLNGIFAFALWDETRRELFLARDHNGVKPLYYFFDPSSASGQARLIFSSEIKAILEHNVAREVDRDAFALYMRLLYVPAPYTGFKGIKKLPPAHWLALSGGKIEMGKYWEVTDLSDLTDREEATKQVRALFDDSVQRQLISDRPVGVFLSGGSDSTAVLGAAAKVHSGPLETFSVGFEVPEQSEKFNADLFLARKTAEHYGTEHHELMINAHEVGENLEKIAWHLDEPNGNPTAAAIFLLSRLAKERVAVVLGGDGADELFGGYRRYALARLRRLWHGPTGTLLSFMSQKESALGSVLAPEFRWSAAARTHFNPFLAHAGHGDAFVKRFMNTDRQSWLTDDSLLRSDKMTMAAGLEARVPILDHRLILLAYRIPTRWKVRGLGLLDAAFQGKEIWNEAIANYLPPHLAGQPKRGWFTPMAKWVRGELRARVGEILSPQNLNTDFFDAPSVWKMWESHLSGAVYNLNLIWAIVAWELWYKEFFTKKS